MKCLFSQKKLKLSGLAYSEDGMHPDSIQFTETQIVPTAEDTKALQSFLRLMTYFKCFIPQHSTLSYPLTSLKEFQKLVDKYMPDSFRQPQICSYLTFLCRILQYKQRSYHLYWYYLKRNPSSIPQNTPNKEDHRLKILHTHFIHFTPTKRALFPNCEIMICSSVCLWKQTFPL